MSLEDIMLTKISLSQKDKYSVISFFFWSDLLFEVPRVVRFIETAEWWLPGGCKGIGK